MNGKLLQLSLFVALISLFGCTEQRDDLKSYVQRVKSRPARALPPLKLPPDIEPFSYSANSLRDPFSALPSTSTPINPPIPPEVPRQPRPVRPDVEQAESDEPPPSSTLPPTLPQNNVPNTSPRLEDHPLAMLTLVGFIGMHGEQFALVRTPTNAIHRLRIGDTLGKEQGEIVDMGADQIEVAYEDKAAKKPKIRRTTLELKP